MTYQKMFDEIRASDRLKQEVQNMTNQKTNCVRGRSIPRVVLIAAIVVVLLAGTTLAANLFGIRDWFAEQWQEETGSTISTDQLGLIDQLTQEINVSDTKNGVTVTVDSVTRGEGILWMLLEIDGDFSIPEDSSAYFAAPFTLDFSPELEIAGSAWQFTGGGFREDGSWMVLLRYVPPLTGDATFLDAYDVALTMETLMWNGEITAEGPWNLNFSLEQIDPPETLTLDGTITADAISMEHPDTPTKIEFYDIRVTPTEIWLTSESQENILKVFASWGLVLKDGTEIHNEGGVYYDLPDGIQASVYYWSVPVNLSQVSGLSSGTETFPLN